MDYSKRWKIIEELGEGGQGKVYRALDRGKINIDHEVLPSLEKTLRELTATIPDPKNAGTILESLRKSLVDIIRAEDPSHHGALKVLHEPKDARDAELANVRIAREIQAMSDISHPNLIKILDTDLGKKWFVSQYHPKGTLSDNRANFTGNFVESLKAFRPLVEGVSHLHDKEIVHRDIKPQNIFLDSEDNLILGDFGLVSFIDQEHTRISGTFENVGSRDWMPGWATNMRVEDITPSFDVFCLGKLFWSMVANIPTLRLWYYDRSEFDLERLFPESPSIKLANPLFEKCIVENEEDCLPSATELLEEVDKVLNIIDINAEQFDISDNKPCKVCGIGNYELIVDRNNTDARNFGIQPAGTRTFKIFTCDHCGNVRLFTFSGGQNPSAWQE